MPKKKSSNIIASETLAMPLPAKDEQVSFPSAADRFKDKPLPEAEYMWTAPEEARRAEQRKQAAQQGVPQAGAERRVGPYKRTGPDGMGTLPAPEPEIPANAYVPVGDGLWDARMVERFLSSVQGETYGAAFAEQDGFKAMYLRNPGETGAILREIRAGDPEGFDRSIDIYQGVIEYDRNLSLARGAGFDTGDPGVRAMLYRSTLRGADVEGVLNGLGRLPEGAGAAESIEAFYGRLGRDTAPGPGAYDVERHEALDLAAEFDRTLLGPHGEPASEAEREYYAARRDKARKEWDDMVTQSRITAMAASHKLLRDIMRGGDREDEYLRQAQALVEMGRTQDAVRLVNNLRYVREDIDSFKLLEDNSYSDVMAGLILKYTGDSGSHPGDTMKRLQVMADFLTGYRNDIEANAAEIYQKKAMEAMGVGGDGLESKDGAMQTQTLRARTVELQRKAGISRLDLLTPEQEQQKRTEWAACETLEEKVDWCLNLSKESGHYAGSEIREMENMPRSLEPILNALARNKRMERDVRQLIPILVLEDKYGYGAAKRLLDFGDEEGAVKDDLARDEVGSVILAQIEGNVGGGEYGEDLQTLLDDLVLAELTLKDKGFARKVLNKMFFAIGEDKGALLLLPKSNDPMLESAMEHGAEPTLTHLYAVGALGDWLEVKMRGQNKRNEDLIEQDLLRHAVLVNHPDSNNKFYLHNTLTNETFDFGLTVTDLMAGAIYGDIMGPVVLRNMREYGTVEPVARYGPEGSLWWMYQIWRQRKASDYTLDEEGVQFVKANRDRILEMEDLRQSSPFQNPMSTPDIDDSIRLQAFSSYAPDIPKHIDSKQYMKDREMEAGEYFKAFFGKMANDNMAIGFFTDFWIWASEGESGWLESEEQWKNEGYYREGLEWGGRVSRMRARKAVLDWEINETLENAEGKISPELVLTAIIIREYTENLDPLERLHKLYKPTGAGAFTEYGKQVVKEMTAQMLEEGIRKFVNDTRDAYFHNPAVASKIDTQAVLDWLNNAELDWAVEKVGEATTSLVK